MGLEPLAMVNGFQRHSFHIVQVPFQSMQTLLSYQYAKNADRWLFSFKHYYNRLCNSYCIAQTSPVQCALNRI